MRYRIAILGCGHIGKKHAALASAYGELIAVADSQEDRARDLAALYHCNSYPSLEQLIDNESPDLIAICTPNGFHAQHSIETLRSGAHVLCEKPMAISVRDAESMRDAAIKYNKRLFVVKQNRFNPPVLWLKQLLDSGRLGRILGFQLNAFWNRGPAYFHQSAWRGSLQLDGGPLFTQFSHFIDLLHWFLGDLKSVHHARGQNLLHRDTIEFEDQGLAVLELGDGIQGCLQYSINAHDRNMEGSITLFGEKGTVKLGGTYLNKLEHVAVEGIAAPVFVEQVPGNQYGSYEGSSSQHHLVYEAVLRSLDDPSYQYLEAAEAIQTISIIESIYSNMEERFS